MSEVTQIKKQDIKGDHVNVQKDNEELLPVKSRLLYDKEYHKFAEWLSQNQDKTLCEAVLLEYFQELGESFSPNSLWTKYSMLRSTLLIHRKIDIKYYNDLDSYLRQFSKGYIPKKSKSLTQEDVLKFFREAPTDIYLLEKVVMIMSIFGGLRRNDLVRLTLDDVTDNGNIVVVKIQSTSKMFIIEEEDEIHALQLYRKYKSMRPKGLKERRFFLAYRDGKCTAQPVGKNTFGRVPSKVAKYLGYPDCNEFTGQCLRHASVTLGVGNADLQSLKRIRDTDDNVPQKSKLPRLFNEKCTNNELVNLDIVTSTFSCSEDDSTSNSVYIKQETNASSISSREEECCKNQELTNISTELASYNDTTLELGNCTFTSCSFTNCTFNIKSLDK